MIARRGFIAGLAGLLATPAIVRATSLMPVSVPKLPGSSIWLVGWNDMPVFGIYPDADNVIRLSWSMVQAATSYNVYRGPPVDPFEPTRLK